MNEKIIDAIYRAVEEVNMMRPSGQALELVPSTELIGDRGLDSLELVNFVVQVEQNLTDALGETVVLVQEGMDFQNGSFDTIETLTQFIHSKL